MRLGRFLSAATTRLAGIDPALHGGSGLGDLLCFLIAATLFIKLHVVGEFLGSDIVTLLALPLLLTKRFGRLHSRFARRFLGLGSLGLISLIVTDVWRESALDDVLRGWSRAGLFLISFSVLFTLIRSRPARIIYFSAGLALQGYLAFVFAPTDYARDEPWKFGVAAPTTLTILLLGTYLDRQRVSPRWSLLACLLAGLVNIVFTFRSLGGICLAAALVLYIARSALGRKLPTPALTVMALLGIIGLMQLYGGLASSGVLGEQARSKHETQGSGQYGLIGGGRSEFFGSLLAISDSPILGHGSWAKDPKYQWEGKELRREAGYKDQPVSFYESGLIPAHSHLFGAWVEGGIGSAILWFWILFAAVRSLLSVARSPHMAGLRTFFCLSLLWDVLFSPPGGVMRYVTVFNVVVVCAPEVFALLPATRRSLGRLVPARV